MRTFDAKSFNSARKRGFFIRVQPKMGVIGLSRDLCLAMGEDVSGITFAQDEKKPEDWFIRPDCGDNAFKFSKTNSKSTLIRSTPLCREILQACGLEVKNTKFMVSSTPSDNGYAVITKSAKQKD